ncbi:hypothetical protein CRUP_006127 [Coryphaenoides rupestris]|nr:hypothetical protein CRUP_006127 [Coryphaenoides rupestris]
MEALRKEREVGEMLSAKVKAMESKLLVGGKNIVDHTNEQQRILEQKRHEIAEQKRREREMQQQVENRDEETLGLKETYSSLQQEVDIKTKKLKKLFAKLQAVKAEIQDVQEAHIKERQDLEQNQNELTRELKLKHLIIENFIAMEEKNKIVSRAFFDEEDDRWKVKAITRLEDDHQMMSRPVSAVGYRRPLSHHARVAMMMRPEVRYKAENILKLELDLPERTTREYEEPLIRAQRGGGPGGGTPGRGRDPGGRLGLPQQPGVLGGSQPCRRCRQPPQGQVGPNENGQEVQHADVAVQPVQPGVSALPPVPWPGAQMTPVLPTPAATHHHAIAPSHPEP